MKKKLLLIGGIAAMLFSSCDQDITNVINLPGGESSNTPATQKEITFTASMDGVNTRAVETTIDNLDSFFVTAVNKNGAYGDTIWMQGVKYIKPNQENVWSPENGNYYWPMNGSLGVYAYANIGAGKDTINVEKQEITFYQQGETAAQHQDFVYAKRNVFLGKSPNLAFKHALSEVSIKAKNSNTEYTVEVSGVKISNMASWGLFDLDKESWTVNTAYMSYSTTWSTPVKLTADASYMDKANEPFMFVPQTLDKNLSARKAQSQIYAKIKVIKDNVTIYDGWSSMPLSGTLEMGKHYVYTLDFSQGLGSNIYIGKIDFGTSSVSVTDWVSKDVSVSYGH